MKMCYNGTLVMPKNYAVVDNDEMEYIDGGVTYTSAESLQIVANLGLASGHILISMSCAAVVVSKVLKWAKRVGGPIAWILGAAGKLIAGAVGKIAYGIGYSAISGKTVEICSSWKPWESFVNVECW